jgi:hypothetical protein
MGIDGGENAVVKHDIQFCGSGFDGGARFVEFGVRVLGSFMEAYYAGYDDRRAFEVGDAAGDVVKADTDALDSVSIWLIEEHAKNVYDVNYCSKKTDVAKNVEQSQTSISCFQYK